MSKRVKEVMVAQRDGGRFWIPRSRRLTTDVMHWHRQVPVCPHDRLSPLGEIETLRAGLTQRISWVSLFLKAYGLVAAEIPELRQTWMPHLFPTIYQHPESVGMVAISREFRGEPWVFWGRFIAPEKAPLVEIQRRLESYQTAPVTEIFQRQLQLSAMPTPLRRFVWWCNLALSGKSRARRIGTFFLTTLAGRGAEIALPLSFHTGNLTYGPLTDDGVSRVTLAYDHRIMDGALVADGLQKLEQTLLGPIAAELRSLPRINEAKQDQMRDAA